MYRHTELTVDSVRIYLEALTIIDTELKIWEVVIDSEMGISCLCVLSEKVI